MTSRSLFGFYTSMQVSANLVSNFDSSALKMIKIATFLSFPTSTLFGLSNLILFHRYYCTLRHKTSCFMVQVVQVVYVPQPRVLEPANQKICFSTLLKELCNYIFYVNGRLNIDD